MRLESVIEFEHSFCDVFDHMTLLTNHCIHLILYPAENFWGGLCGGWIVGVVFTRHVETGPRRATENLQRQRKLVGQEKKLSQEMEGMTINVFQNCFIFMVMASDMFTFTPTHALKHAIWLVEKAESKSMVGREGKPE